MSRYLLLPAVVLGHGSLRDVIHGVSPSQSVHAKYDRVGSPLSERKCASIGRALLDALGRALTLYRADGGRHYAALRANAHAAACDVSDTAWHWRCELTRLRACANRARLHEVV